MNILKSEEDLSRGNPRVICVVCHKPVLKRQQVDSEKCPNCDEIRGAATARKACYVLMWILLVFGLSLAIPAFILIPLHGPNSFGNYTWRGRSGGSYHTMTFTPNELLVFQMFCGSMVLASFVPGLLYRKNVKKIKMLVDPED